MQNYICISASKTCSHYLKLLAILNLVSRPFCRLLPTTFFSLFETWSWWNHFAAAPRPCYIWPLWPFCRRRRLVLNAKAAAEGRERPEKAGTKEIGVVKSKNSKSIKNEEERSSQFKSEAAGDETWIKATRPERKRSGSDTFHNWRHEQFTSESKKPWNNFFGPFMSDKWFQVVGWIWSCNFFPLQPLFVANVRTCHAVTNSWLWARNETGGLGCNLQMANHFLYRTILHIINKAFPASLWNSCHITFSHSKWFLRIFQKILKLYVGKCRKFSKKWCTFSRNYQCLTPGYDSENRCFQTQKMLLCCQLTSSTNIVHYFNKFTFELFSFTEREDYKN